MHASGSDGAILARACEGDLEAFETFVRSTERRVRAVLGRFLDDERDVDEAAQDTYVQVWRRLHTFRGDAAPTTWLHRIAVNVALQRLRRNILATTPLDQLPELASAASAPDAAAEQRELQDFITDRLRAMPIEYRAPVVLRDIEGWSTEAVAAAMELSVAAVKSRVHRGRMHLRAEIERWRDGSG